VKAFDDYLLNVISGPTQSNPILYKTWLKANAKLVKSLLAGRERGRRKRAKLTPQKKPNASKPMVKKQGKRKASEVVDLAKYDKAPMKKPAASGGASAASASAPPVCAAGSGRASAASASALPELAAASGGVSAASASAPPVQIASNDCIDLEVDITDISYTMKAKDILARAGCEQIVCCVCKREINGEAMTVVTSEGPRHQICLDEASAVLEAAKTSPIDPLGPQRLKAASKIAKASNMVDATDISEDTANAKHEELMEFGSQLKKKGQAKGMHWNIRYEPTKKKGSWRNTKHAVVLRWSDGTSKTQNFSFKEHQHSLDEFKVELETAMQAVIDEQIQ
jgi:hypothetical protein